MSPLGLKIYEWLRTQGDVTLLRDASDRRTGEAITCGYGGASYRIMVDSGPSGQAVDDSRSCPYYEC